MLLVIGLETQVHLDTLNCPAVKSQLNTLLYIPTPGFQAVLSLHLQSGTIPIKHTDLALGSKFQILSWGLE